jgi:hypothetical protein
MARSTIVATLEGAREASLRFRDGSVLYATISSASAESVTCVPWGRGRVRIHLRDVVGAVVVTACRREDVIRISEQQRKARDAR